MSTAPPTGIVTFLFTDIQGSTQLLQALGSAYADVQTAHQRIMRNAIATRNGAEIRTEGDSFFVAFAHPADAVGAAVAAQRDLAAAAWPHGDPLQVRMGLHTGEGRLHQGDYLGIDVNRAARIAASAHGGQVVISDATRGLVEHHLPEGVSVRDLGEHRLKDLSHPEHLFDLVIDGLPSEFPPLKSLDARPNNLPPEVTSFVGRADELDALVDLLRTERLVTLTGPGGTGKTRLSLQAAHRLLPDFADGAFFVDLSPISEPELVASAVAQALGVAEHPQRSTVQSLREHLRSRQILVVLDNFEQVVEAADVAPQLLEAGPAVTVLVTSRIPLHVYGEQEVAVQPLGLPDAAPADVERLSQFEAVALFIDRARAVRRDFQVTNENAPAVAELCVRLDGLPLAIELAAVRVKLLSPEEILARLGQGLPSLGSGARNLPERQRTLRNTIAWSHDLLDQRERRLFARLAAFSGGATLEAIDAVANPDGELGMDTLDGVASLMDKSLVWRREVDGEARFGMLETIREFAAERLAEADDDAVRRRHAEHLRDLAVRAEPHFTGEDDVAWLDRFEREHDNVRAALRWTIEQEEPEIGLILGASIWRFWFQRGHLREGYGWMTRLLSLPTAADRPAALAKGHTGAGGLVYWMGDMEATERHYSAALDLYRSLDDRDHLSEALTNVAFVPMLAGDHARGIPLMEEALTIAREIGNPTRIAEAAGSLGYALLIKGDADAAQPLIEEEISVARAIGDRFHLADGLAALGVVHFLHGDRTGARDVSLEALGIFHEQNNLTAVSMMFEAVAGWEGHFGSLERAARLWGAALQLRDSTGGGAPDSSQVMGNPVPKARSALGDEVVDELIDEGRAMEVDDAVAYAIGDEGASAHG